MIVVINPGGKGGHSFAGLHAYCSHDQDQASTSERVDWIEMRNLTANDPNHAPKIMAATAYAQNALKKANGIRPGPAPKDGAVMHVVLAFDKDEPNDKATMMAAADEFLTKLGADPAKMRGKSKPKRRQFADEHQVVMYAHNDGAAPHLHLAINIIHPDTGLKLPDNNNFNKASRWAEAWSKRHGTDHKTPARAENNADRDRGEYVKGERRKPRNVFELERDIERAGNDNASGSGSGGKGTIDRIRRENARLMLKGRNLQQRHVREIDREHEAHASRKKSAKQTLKSAIRLAQNKARERFRQEIRDLNDLHRHERESFDGREATWLGKAGSIASSLGRVVRGESSAHQKIKQAFNVTIRRSERWNTLIASQEARERTVQRKKLKMVGEMTKGAKSTYRASILRLGGVFTEKFADLKKRQHIEVQRHQAEWRKRTAERERLLDGQAVTNPARGPSLSSPLEEADEAKRTPAREQNNRPASPPLPEISRDEFKRQFRETLKDVTRTDNGCDRDKDRGR